MALEKIRVTSLAHIHYQHPDLEKAVAFFSDFGFIEAHRDATKIYLRGCGAQLYIYVAEQSPDDKRHFIGAYWVVASLEELQKAAAYRNASQIRDNVGYGNGKVVTTKDPNGFIVGFLYGQTLRTPTIDELRLNLETSVPTPNSVAKKLRKGNTRRFRRGPSPVYKLGHYGIIVPKDRYEETLNWYTTILNLKPTDAIFDPQTNKEVTCFAHIDLGADYTDHHSFFVGASADANSAYPHHCSFEVNDLDSQALGHDWLRSKGWTNCWGIGRHILGSQIFDYWFDASGNIVEHYSDGDMVNETTPFERMPGGPDSLYIWGPSLPLGFVTGKIEDAHKLVVTPPNVLESKPAQYSDVSATENRS